MPPPNHRPKTPARPDPPPARVRRPSPRPPPARGSAEAGPDTLSGLRSMTGFGRGETQAGTLRVVVELSSVNRKQFDCQISLPRDMTGLEATLQARIRAVVRRGTVRGSARIEARRVSDPCAGAVRFHPQSAERLVREIRQAGRRMGLEGELHLRDLLFLPGVFVTEENGPEDRSIRPAVEDALDKALKALENMRRREGRHLGAELERGTRRLRRLLDAIARQAPAAIRAWRTALLRRLREFRAALPADGTAIEREVALLADRGDIREEVVRARSHLDQFAETLGHGGPCGRTLDFLCQELFREINTLGVKANHTPIARLSIRFKSELEALREQVQNIE